MSNSSIRYRAKLSLTQAKDKIAVYGMFGEHEHRPRPKNIQEVNLLLVKLGTDPSKLAEKCRSHSYTIPFFESYKINNWTFDTFKGGTFSIVDKKTQKTIRESQGSGSVALSAYLAKFETACAARDRAVGKSSFIEYEAAISGGFASIEAYIFEAVENWNTNNSSDKLVDSNSNKVSLLVKLDDWIPKMTGGNKLVKSDQRWADFKKLKEVRDNKVIHSKTSIYFDTHEEICDSINAFRCGIAGMLGQLHLVFRKPVPSVVINAFYMPDVIVKK